MRFFGRFSPLRAYQDLRAFLAQRQPYELGFLVLAMALTGFFIFAFAKDSHVEREYKPNIIYVQQWPLDRTDAQIKAQQVIDQAAKDKRLAEQKAEQDQKRAEFQRLDNQLDKWGI